MKKLTVFAGVSASVLACFVSIIAISSPSSGQATGGGAVPAQLVQTPAAHEVWMALRSDGQAGTGTVTDPFDASSVQKFNALFERFAKEYGENLTIHLGPGVFYGDRGIRASSNWKFLGAGRDITILRTRPNADATDTIGIGWDNLNGVEVSDITFDFNTPNLRKANRVFVYFESKQPRVYYYYVKSLPAWSDKQSYKRDLDTAVAHKGAEYICIAANQGKEPAQGELWSILRSCETAKLPAWEQGKSYAIGNAVAQAGKGYICVAANTKTNPSADASNWRSIRTDAPDPRIYTGAVFVFGSAPKGHHRVYRCKAIHGHGSWFFGREAFLFGLGGNDCTIEDCQVSDFLGDYGSLIVIMSGQNCVIRNCSVRGINTLGTIAYGGWAVHDSTFENNYCNNVGHAVNIDSLTCRNVTFRGNTFMGCHYVGLLVNVAGSYPVCNEYTLNIDGTVISTAPNRVDGLFIHDNLIEVTSDCLYGGIQVQQDGLSNVKIHNNVIRTPDGKGHGRRAIGVLGRQDTHVQITDNTCDPDMCCEIGVPAIGWGNVDLQGQPIKGLEKLTRPGQ